MSLLHLAWAARKQSVPQFVFVLFNDGSLAQKLRETGARVYVIQERGFPLDVSIVFRLTRILRTERITVVHTHGYKSNVIGGLAARLTKRPLLVRTEHGMPPPISRTGHFSVSPFSVLDYLIGRSWTDCIIAVSRDLSLILAKRYPPRHIRTIYNGVDIAPHTDPLRVHHLRSEFALSANDAVIGIFCRLMPIKALDIFLRAARLITVNVQNVRFFVVGDGPLYDSLRSEAQRLGLERRMTFTGFRHDALDLVRMMQVIVLSSLHEGLPMILLEAMALGKPVVATRVGGIPELIQDGVTGILVPPADPDSLANACLDLIRKPSIAEELGRRAQHQVEAHFTAEKMLEDLLKVYADCLQAARSPRVFAIDPRTG